MKRRQWTFALGALIATMSAALAVVPFSLAQPKRVAAQTKTDAERNVLRIAARSWNHRRIAALIDRRTGLLRNNVQVVCRGRGHRLSGRRYHRYVCAIRPWPHKGQRQFYVSYRALPAGRFRAHWLRYSRK